MALSRVWVWGVGLRLFAFRVYGCGVESLGVLVFSVWGFGIYGVGSAREG